MGRTWQLQEAKNHFSEVVELAQTEGPQVVTRHGTAVAVIVAKADFDKGRAARRGRGSLVRFLQSLSFARAELDLERSRDRDRDVEL